MKNKFDDYSNYSKEELVEKIRSAIDQLNHVKTWSQQALGIPCEKAEELGHSIDHAITDLSGDLSNDLSVVEQLRTGFTKEPTTKRGE